MPNVGRPSRDCHLCRARRVKCDLGRPGCQRCVKYGKDCPGYRDQQELVFRVVDPKTTTIEGGVAPRRKKASQRKKQAQHRQHVWEASASVSSPESTSSDSSSEGAGWTIAPSLSQHWTASSVPIVLTVYSTIDFLRDVFQEKSYDGPLVWATHLFSRTYVTNLNQPTSISKESASEKALEMGIYMGKTLTAVSSALQTPEGAFRDDIIGAVWMLGNYEIIVGSLGRMEKDSPWHAHVAGLYGILKARGLRGLQTERGRQIFWNCFTLVELDAILTNKPAPPEAEEWLSTVKLIQGRSLSHTIATCLVKVCSFQARAGAIIFSGDATAASAEHTALSSALIGAQRDLEDYIASFGRDTYISEDFMIIQPLGALVKAYNFLLLLTNLATYDTKNSTPLEVLYKRREDCLARVRAVAWKILAVTPTLIDDLMQKRYNLFGAMFQALRLVWPLTTVRLMPTTLPHQKAQSAQTLLMIGRQLGVRQATRSYDMADAIPKEARVPRVPAMGFIGSTDFGNDLCRGYMDAELREPSPEELVGDMPLLGPVKKGSKHLVY